MFDCTSDPKAKLTQLRVRIKYININGHVKVLPSPLYRKARQICHLQTASTRMRRRVTRRLIRIQAG